MSSISLGHVLSSIKAGTRYPITPDDIPDLLAQAGSNRNTLRLLVKVYPGLIVTRERISELLAKGDAVMMGYFLRTARRIGLDFSSDIFEEALQTGNAHMISKALDGVPGLPRDKYVPLFELDLGEHYHSMWDLIYRSTNSLMEAVVTIREHLVSISDDMLQIGSRLLEWVREFPDTYYEAIVYLVSTYGNELVRDSYLLNDVVEKSETELFDYLMTTNLPPDIIRASRPPVWSSELEYMINNESSFRLAAERYDLHMMHGLYNADNGVMDTKTTFYLVQNLLYKSKRNDPQLKPVIEFIASREPALIKESASYYIYEAAQKGSADLVRYLITNFGSPEDVLPKGSYGYDWNSPLVGALRNRNLQGVQELVRMGATLSSGIRHRDSCQSVIAWLLGVLTELSVSDDSLADYLLEIYRLSAKNIDLDLGTLRPIDLSLIPQTLKVLLAIGFRFPEGIPLKPEAYPTSKEIRKVRYRVWFSDSLASRLLDDQTV